MKTGLIVQYGPVHVTGELITIDENRQWLNNRF